MLNNNLFLILLFMLIFIICCISYKLFNKIILSISLFFLLISTLFIVLKALLLLLMAILLFFVIVLFLLNKKVNNRQMIPTNADMLIGKIGVVTSPIKGKIDRGRVTVDNINWAARIDEDINLMPNDYVQIIRIEGVTLIVSLIKREH